MWTRLYAETPLQALPWGLRDPFPPLVRLVEGGWLPPPGPILDVGCGIGPNAFWLSGRGYRVTGIDIAPGAVAAAKVARPSEAASPDFLVDDILASTLPSARFRGAVDAAVSRPFLRGRGSLTLPGSPV